MLGLSPARQTPGPWAAGLQYFALVFGAGFVLGIVRVVWLAPRLGERAAQLAEMPVMLAVIVAAAIFVVRRFRLPPVTSQRLGTGLFAVALLLLAEFLVVLPVRGMTPAEYVAGRDPVTAAAYYGALVVMAFMPALVVRR